MIDCCERLALVLVAGHVIALGDSQLGQDWLKHHLTIHAVGNDAGGETCSTCREAAMDIMPQIENDMQPRAHTAPVMHRLAATLSELLK